MASTANIRSPSSGRGSLCSCQKILDQRLQVRTNDLVQESDSYALSTVKPLTFPEGLVGIVNEQFQRHSSLKACSLVPSGGSFAVPGTDGCHSTKKRLVYPDRCRPPSYNVASGDERMRLFIRSGGSVN